MEKLTEEEKEIAKKIASVLATKYIGKSNSISATIICNRVEDKNYKLSTEKLRAMIQWLRMQGFRICSSPKGYWYAANKQEFKECAERLKSRIESQRATLLSMKSILDSW